MSKKLTLILAIVVIIIILIVLGDNRGNEKLSGESIKIGALLPLTGNISSFGEDVRNGLELAKDELNSRGANIEIFYEDSAGEAKIALPAARKLIDINNVVFVIGGPGSTANLATVPIFEEEQMPFVVLSASGGLVDAGEYIFKFIPDIRDEVMFITRVFDAAGVSKVAILFDQSSDSNTQAKDTFLQESEAEIFVEGFDGNSLTDFRSSLTKVKNFNPDLVYVISNDKVAAPLITQAREIGLTQDIYGWSGMETQNFIDNVGQNGEGVILTGLPYSCSSNPAQSGFCEKYKEAFSGREPGYYGANAYVLLKIIAEGVKDGEDIQESILDILTSTEYNSLIGKFRMDDKGNVADVEFVLRILRDGKFVELK